MPRSIPLVALSFLAVVLAACATAPDPHGPGHGQAMTDACTAHSEARSAEELRAAAEAHIVRMHGQADAQHVERHLRMMQMRCGG